MLPLPRLAELRLGAFKSHVDQRSSFEPITLLIGRNGSGKSNVLDALELLRRLLEGSRLPQLQADGSGANPRGGLGAAVPFGRTAIELGATVELPDGDRLDYEISLQPGGAQHGDGAITRERLTLRPTDEKKPRVLVRAEARHVDDGITSVQVYSGRMPKTLVFPSSSSAVAQAITKVPEDTQARRLVTRCCADFIAAVRGLFVLDPVPSAMRGYARLGSPQTRSGSATSAVIYRLKKSPESWGRLVQMAIDLVEADISGLSFAEGRLPGAETTDVMVALKEKLAKKRRIVPANLMSDGTLRYLAIVATLLEMADSVASAEPNAARRGVSTLVVEELENGLFPSQARRMLSFLRREVSERAVQLIATTHSPALLDALQVEDHAGVVICERGEDGFSELRRLTEHPRYVELAAEGRVGSALARGVLEREVPPKLSLADLLAG